MFLRNIHWQTLTRKLFYRGSINRTGFLGCLRQVQIEQFSQDLLTGETVGVTNGCPSEVSHCYFIGCSFVGSVRMWRAFLLEMSFEKNFQPQVFIDYWIWAFFQVQTRRKHLSWYILIYTLIALIIEYQKFYLLVLISIYNFLSIQGYRTIGFYGNGFAKYKAASLPADKADISLSFRTTQEDALLLLAYDNDQRV